MAGEWVWADGRDLALVLDRAGSLALVSVGGAGVPVWLPETALWAYPARALRAESAGGAA